MTVTFENPYCKALLRDMLISMRSHRNFNENMSLLVYTYVKNNNFVGFEGEHCTWAIDSNQYDVDNLNRACFIKTVMSYSDLAKLVNI